MTTLKQRMILSNESIENSYNFMASIQLNAFETLNLICAELAIDLTNVTNSEFNDCAMQLARFNRSSCQDNLTCYVIFESN